MKMKKDCFNQKGRLNPGNIWNSSCIRHCCTFIHLYLPSFQSYLQKIKLEVKHEKTTNETISFRPRGWQGKLIVVHSVRPADEINFFWFMLSAGRTEWTKSKGDFPPGRRSKQKVVEVIRRADGKRRSHWNGRFKWQVKKERRNLWSKKSSLDLNLVIFLSVLNNSRKHYADILARRKGKEPKAELG